jgi:hypothetical protein
MQALTGCSNPNTRVSNGDWGLGTNPIYTTINNLTPTVGMPIYPTNVVFWTSRENAPGQSILLASASQMHRKLLDWLSFHPERLIGRAWLEEVQL